MGLKGHRALSDVLHHCVIYGQICSVMYVLSISDLHINILNLCHKIQ